MQGRPIVILSDRCLNQIKYLCSVISKVEWSGIIFFKELEGSLADPDTFKVEVVELYPMSKDTGAATGFEYDGDVMQFIMTNPELMDCVQGFIHSHHDLGVFFSGTDMSELADNSINHNYYLSIVVNNAGKIIAKIGVHTLLDSIIQGTKKWKGMNGEELSAPFNRIEQQEVLEHYDCIVEGSTIEVDKWFEDRTAKIIEDAAVKYVQKTPAHVSSWINQQPSLFSSNEKPLVFVAKFIARDLAFVGMVYDAMKLLEFEAKDEEDLNVLADEYVDSFDTIMDNYFVSSIPDEVAIVDTAKKQISVYKTQFPKAFEILNVVFDEIETTQEVDEFDLSNPNNTGFYGK